MSDYSKLEVIADAKRRAGHFRQSKADMALERAESILTDDDMELVSRIMDKVEVFLDAETDD